MPTNTLTSLAILKVNIDQSIDYLDYLRPFVLQVLVDSELDPVTGSGISSRIRDQFGLAIPEQVVEFVLRRLSKSRSIRRLNGEYHVVGTLPDPLIAQKQAGAERHIGAVLHGLQKFSQDTIDPIDSNEDAITAICTFLAEFDIVCLRAYLRGTAIPTIGGSHKAAIVLVSEYVQHLQQTDPERFDSFLILVQGHMLANALTCPDLHRAPKTYSAVTFYIDTPLLIRRLGSEGEAKEAAARDLIDLLNNLGGRVAVFSHSRREIQNVLRSAANYLESPDARGSIVFEARKNGTTRSDLILLAESLDFELDKASIEVVDTPRYINEFQIDETVFEQVLEDGISYYNPRAIEYDINSVRSIYVIRGDTQPTAVEKAGAVFVTTNAAFAKAAWDYGQKYESSQNVSSVITDFTLANMAWLKAPMGAPSVPTTQLLAFSYAALEPSSKLLGRYLSEIDRLESQGTINERDHQLLRSSPLVYGEIMHRTLGDETALTTEAITETLKRVSGEIKEEETQRFTAERNAHQETLHELGCQRHRNREIVRKLYWRCNGRAKALATFTTMAVAIVLAVGLLAGLGLFSEFGLRLTPPFSWILAGAPALLALATLVSLVFGFNVRDMYSLSQNKLRTWLLTREAGAIGINLSEFDIES